MTMIDASCARAEQSGWTCGVTLTDADGSMSSHRVALADEDLARLAPGATDPHELVERSFRFLLAHEPKESILRSFDLPVIGHYFPDFEPTIRR
jgi:hypothetical protein